MILFAPHRGQLATSSDILLWLDVDFQIEMYLAESSQFYTINAQRLFVTRTLNPSGV